ncbi:hypothetical protein M9H77_00174 [Catharanthus roseus]|nr:hypothetical protein M9H77_00174 [Catharanthus roseus]
MCLVKLYNVLAKMKKKRINCDESNVPSDIVVAYLTSIQLMRTWTFVLIMDTTYTMPLLEAIRMTPTDKNFTGMRKMFNAHEPVVIVTDRKSGLILVIDENCLNESITTSRPCLTALAATIASSFRTGVLEEEEEDQCSDLLRPRKKKKKEKSSL